MSEEKYHGHATTEDGEHIPLTAEMAESLWKASEKAAADRRERIPDTKAALRCVNDAIATLREQGWREGHYCPKDGTPFALIQYGSTGIFEGWYSGEWPSGRIYCCDYLNHPDGVMWKAIEDLTDDEKKKLDECMESERKYHDRMISSMVETES